MDGRSGQVGHVPSGRDREGLVRGKSACEAPVILSCQVEPGDHEDPFRTSAENHCGVSDVPPAGCQAGRPSKRKPEKWPAPWRLSSSVVGSTDETDDGKCDADGEHD